MNTPVENRTYERHRNPRSQLVVSAAAQGEHERLASLLAEIGELLADQGASQFRVQAYRAAAKTIACLDSPVREIFDRDGIEGLVAVPTIGISIAHLIEQYLRSGHIPLLDRLRGDESTERLFESVAGLGPELSRRIHEQLEVETLPELLAAASDGRLEQVPRHRTETNSGGP